MFRLRGHTSFEATFIEAVTGYSGRVACFEAEAWLVKQQPPNHITRMDQASTLAFSRSYSWSLIAPRSCRSASLVS